MGLYVLLLSLFLICEGYSEENAIIRVSEENVGEGGA